MKSALPKVLHRIANRPMIEHVLARGRRRSRRRASSSWSAPGMEAVARGGGAGRDGGPGSPRGTGHAVAAARPALDGFAGDVLVLYGDAPLLTAETLRAVLAERRRAPAAAAVVSACGRPIPAPYGRLVLAGDGTLEAIVEARDCTRGAARDRSLQRRRHGDRRRRCSSARCRRGRHRQRQGRILSDRHRRRRARARAAPAAPSRRRPRRCWASTAAPSWPRPRR